MHLHPTEDFIMIAENADGRALLEFVADALLVRPFRPKLVNENLELILRDSFRTD